MLDALHKHFQPEITLLHVLPPPHYEYSMADLGGGIVQEYSAARTEQVRKDLEYFLDEELKHFKINRVLLEGDPARKVVEYAHSSQIDLIVMPTHGYGGFRRFMLGSVTAKVLHDADCPVLTGVHLEEVPEPEENKVDHVGVAIDLGPMSEKLLRWADAFARTAGAKLTIFHVTPSVEGMSGEVFEPNWKARFAEEAAKRIADLQQAAGSNAGVKFDAGDVATKVSALAKDAGIEVMVVGRGHSAGMFGRIRAHAYSIIRLSPCPVISV
jgi:nucleotide-binding universal stress UspA family protein